MKVKQAKVQVRPVVDLPCGTQPPPKSDWIAPTQQARRGCQTSFSGKLQLQRVAEFNFWCLGQNTSKGPACAHAPCHSLAICFFRGNPDGA